MATEMEPDTELERELERLRAGDGPNMDTEVVLVTGASGFLGQHIVKLLHIQSPLTAEIRTLDIVPFENNLDFREVKPMVHFTGDIRDLDSILPAFEGVGTVIHAAGLVSFSAFPDVKTIEDVNVRGTENVVNACLRHNVQRMIFTSTVDVVVGWEEKENIDESVTPPEKLLFKAYGESKQKAERIVNLAHQLDGPNKLTTLVLRPTVLYGEGDPYYVPGALRMAHASGGILPRLGNGTARFQQTYVGNAAWAHLCAMDTLYIRPAAGGKAYFITDHTPFQNSFEFLEFFLKSRTMTLSKWYIPYSVMYYLMLTLEKVVRAIRLVYKINMATSLGAIANINQTTSFSSEQAYARLGYHPIYAFNDAVLRSNGFYMRIDL